MTAIKARKHPAFAIAKLRPAPRQPIKLLPVTLPFQPTWNERIARWAGARG